MVKLVSQEPNASVVQLSGRSFPGIVLQGDTLNNLIKLVSSGDREEISEALKILRSARAHYEAVCNAEGIGLPY